MKKVRWGSAIGALAALPLLGLFYVRYVPLVVPFQMALVPILLTVFILTLARPLWGALFFVIAFPLINNLPYYFGLAEPLPLAPPALILCLAFLWARLARAAVADPSRLEARAIFRPMAVFAALVAASAIIEFLRYSGFFPFVSDGIYEWQANVHRVSAGGAIMSVVFTALNSLTGIGLLWALMKSVKTRASVRTLILGLAASTGLAAGFALFQHFGNPHFGNNPITMSGDLINATFKDALSFGAFMAIVAALFAGVFFWSRRAWRFVFAGLVGVCVFMIFLSGSKSGLVALLPTLLMPAVFSAFGFFRGRRGRTADSRADGPAGRRRIRWIPGIVLSCVLIALGIAYRTEIRRAIVSSRTGIRMGWLLASPKADFVRGDSLWPIAVAMIKDYPLAGVGVGGYIIEMSNYAADMKLKVDTPESAENLPLQVGSELGLVGLLVAAWIFWEIVRTIVGRWKSLSAVPRDRFLLLGLAGGLFSFVLISQVHTFIWSYEIHYTFWLMVALVYGLGRDGARVPGESESALPVRKRLAHRAVFPVGLLVFTAVHLWNATHSLSLESRAAKYGFKQNFGFYQQEKTDDGRDFRWTGKRAGTELLIEKARLEVPLLASHPDISERPVRVRVFLVRRFFKDKRLLGELTLKNSDWRTHEFDLAPEDVGQNAVLLFKVDRTWVPQKALHVPDPRRLGIAVGPIRFKE